MRHEASITHDLHEGDRARRRRRRLRACGTVYTGPFQVPRVAWELNLHIDAGRACCRSRRAWSSRRRSCPARRRCPCARGRFRLIAAAGPWRALRIVRTATRRAVDYLPRADGNGSRPAARRYSQSRVPEWFVSSAAVLHGRRRGRADGAVRLPADALVRRRASGWTRASRRASPRTTLLDPARAAPGRLAAALLHAAARLDGRVRHERGDHARPVAARSRCSRSRWRSGPAGACSASAPAGSRRCCSPSTASSRRTRRRRACTRSWCCSRCWPRRRFLHVFVFRRRALPARVRVATAAHALHAQLGGLLRGRQPGRARSPARASAERPSAARCSATRALAYGGAFVLFTPWLPTLLFQAKHTGAPWPNAPTFGTLHQGHLDRRSTATASPSWCCSAAAPAWRG